MSPHGSWAGTDGHKATTARSLPTVPCSHPASRPPGAGQGLIACKRVLGTLCPCPVPALGTLWLPEEMSPVAKSLWVCGWLLTERLARGTAVSGHQGTMPAAWARVRGVYLLGDGGGGHFLKPFVAHFLIPASPRRTHTRFRGRSCPDCDQHPKCCILNFCTLGPAGCHSPMRLRRDSGWPPGSFRFLPSPSRY